jgi:hypothetical protein
MATILDLPASCRHDLLDDQSGGGWFGELTRDGRRETLTWKVPFEDLDAFLTTAAGKVETWGGTGGVTVLVPLVSPFNSNLWAQRISYRGSGADEATSYLRPTPWVGVQVDFGTNPFPMTGDRPFISTRVQGVANQVTLPNIPFHFSNGWELQQDISVSVGEIAFQVTRHWVPDVDYATATLFPYLGHTNSVAITVGYITCAVGTLLFPTFDTQFQLSAQGDIQSSLSYAVHYRPRPWNQALRADGVWDNLTPAPFPSSDISALFSAYT